MILYQNYEFHDQEYCKIYQVLWVTDTQKLCVDAFCRGLPCVTCRCCFKPVRRYTLVARYGLMILLVSCKDSHSLPVHVIPPCGQLLPSLTVCSVCHHIRYSGMMVFAAYYNCMCNSSVTHGFLWGTHTHRHCHRVDVLSLIIYLSV